jgi:DNA-binding protein H-NS
MTNYHLKPFTTLSTLAAMEKKAARKKLLEAVRERRYQIAKDRRTKEQRAYHQNEEYKEYQDMLKAQGTS